MTEKLKILIVEDESIIARDLQNILISEDYEICGIASNYTESVELFDKRFPDLIICDIYLKERKTGIDFANDISRKRITPIIFITAFSSHDIIEKLNDLNPVSYITKPFTDKQVIAAVKLASFRIKKIQIIPHLPPRQNQILILLKEGIISNSEISKIIGISEHTVKSHKNKLYDAFDVSTYAQLIKIIK